MELPILQCACSATACTLQLSRCLADVDDLVMGANTL